jgi:hypothetical protein
MGATITEINNLPHHRADAGKINKIITKSNTRTFTTTNNNTTENYFTQQQNILTDSEFLSFKAQGDKMDVRTRKYESRWFIEVSVKVTCHVKRHY